MAPKGAILKRMNNEMSETMLATLEGALITSLKSRTDKPWLAIDEAEYKALMTIQRKRKVKVWTRMDLQEYLEK